VKPPGETRERQLGAGRLRGFDGPGGREAIFPLIALLAAIFILPEVYGYEQD
jgi:hypothetical protein